MFGGSSRAEDVIVAEFEHRLVPGDHEFGLGIFSLNHFEDLAHRGGFSRCHRFVVLGRGIKTLSGCGAARIHHESVGVGLRETVVLAQVGNLLWVFLVLDFLHDLKPVRHLLAVSLFNSGEVSLAGWVFRHGSMVNQVVPISLSVHRPISSRIPARHSGFEVCAHETFTYT